LSWPASQDTGDDRYFATTRQSIGKAFYDYWADHGGEQVFGAPISPAAEMASPADGQTYMTQWFQRARMEIHPDLPAGQQVVLASLGRELTGITP
jgi:hypothetical protein